MFLALEFSAAAKSPLRAEIQTAPSSLPPFSEEQLPLLGQDVATDGGVEAGAAASVYPCLFYCFVTSCFSSKVATARQRCGRQSNFGASFAHVSQLPEHWLQQSQPQRPRLLALERGSTTDLQPWSVRCVNKFILKASSTRSGQLSPASLLQVPTRPTSLDGFPGTSRSRRWSRFAVL